MNIGARTNADDFRAARTGESPPGSLPPQRAPVNRSRLAFWWLISSVFVSGATAWAVLRWHVAHEHGKTSEASGHAALDSEERFHAWAHEHLKPSASQVAVLDAGEARFAVRRRELRDVMRTAGDALRSAILRDKSDSTAVKAALDELAAAQAALQKATLAHLFEMAGQLDGPERDKLIHWIHDSLRPPP